MKLECNTKNLLEILSKVEIGTGRNLSLPILGSILLIASGKTLKLRSTNLSLGVEAEIPAKVTTEGVVVTRGDALIQFLTLSLRENTVTIEQMDTKGSLKVYTDNHVVELVTLPHEDFPSIPVIKEGKIAEFTISAKKLIDGLQSVVFAASVSEIKPEIASVFMYEKDSVLMFVATDTFRLAEKSIESKDIMPEVHFIIPLKNIKTIISILGNERKDVFIEASKNQISFTGEYVYLTSRLIEGTFPDYTQIIPKNQTTEVTVLKDDLVKIIKTASLFTNKFNQILIRITPSDKSIVFSTGNSEVGNFESKVVGVIKGEPVEFSINQRHLQEVLSSISTDSVHFAITSPLKPILMKAIGDTSFLYLLMPLNR